MENKNKNVGRAKAWYASQEPIRDSLEQEWRDAAALTLPYIFPIEDQDQSSILPTPFNSIGPSAVNTLAAKLLLPLLPVSGAFFRLLPDREIVGDFNNDQLKQLEKELSKVEQDVIEYINQKGLRKNMFEAIKLLIVTGNVMLYKMPGGGFKIFSPYMYVVQRDYVGNVLTACIKEKFAFESLSEKIQKQLEDDEVSSNVNNINNSNGERKEIDIYTLIERISEKKYKVTQSINNIIISEKDFTDETLPYIVLRWTAVNNEDYGRGLVSQYLGDFRTLEGLTQTITDSAGVSAMNVFGVKPGSPLKIEDLNNAANGSFVVGDLMRDVTTLQVNKGADLQVPLNLMGQLEQRIARAFMMMSGQVRDSERTTATEVRATAAELESTLGGVFSVLASEFQGPVIRLILKELNPDVLKFTTPAITTGISAISRERDYQNLSTMTQAIMQLGPEVLSKYMDISKYLTQVAVSLGMDPEDIIKSPERIQQEEQQAMMAQQQMQAQQVQGQMAVDENKEMVKQQGEQ